MAKLLKFKEAEPEENLLRLDLGAGKGANTPEGFQGVDLVPAKGVRKVDLRARWPWAANSVDEAQANYLLHYLMARDRVHFVNELYRVLKPGGKATIITPSWSASKAYADLAAQFPPVVEAWYPRLSKAWREAQNCADPDGYTCDFDYTQGYGLHPLICSRAQDYQMHAVTFWKEAAQDIVATLTKK